MKAKIFYFTLQDEQTKEEKLDWFDRAFHFTKTSINGQPGARH